MVSDLGDEIAETDANPMLVCGEGKGCRAVDSRVILKKKKSTLEQSKIPAGCSGGDFFVLPSRVLKKAANVIASDRRSRSNLVFSSKNRDCFVVSLLAMTNSDFFRTLLSAFCGD